MALPGFRHRGAPAPGVAAIRQCRRWPRAPARQNRVLPREDQRNHHRDQRQVEQQRRECSDEETALRARKRQQHGGGPRKGEIGQHQARIGDGELQRVVSGKSRRQCGDDQRHEEAEQYGCSDQRRADGAEHGARKARCRDGARRFAKFHPGRHQRRIQRAFREQPPHHIDELEGDQEGVGDPARAEQARDHGIAQIAQQPRGQRAR